MNVLWISDFSVDSKIFGGAEHTEKIMIDEGIKRGHKITMITSEDNVSFDPYLQSNDLFVINNMVRFDTREIEKVITNFMKPFVTYNHDYNFCKFRNADCGFYKCSVCEDGNNMFYDFFDKMFKKSKLNIFLSPLHERLTRNKYPGLSHEVVIPSPINESIFYKDDSVKRGKGYVYVGNIYEGKGIAEMLDKFEKLRIKIDFIGQIWDARLKDRIEKNHNYLGSLPHESMGDVFRKYKYFIRYTPLKESFGRTTAEAKACGCTVLTKGLEIGADSFDCSDEELIKKCVESPTKFWDELEKVC